MTALTPDTRLTRSEDLLTAPVDDELVMMSIEEGAYYSLDDIGAYIWEQLKQPTSISALCADLTARFDVQRRQCQEDVLAFLQELLDEGMVHIVSGNAEQNAG